MRISIAIQHLSYKFRLENLTGICAPNYVKKLSPYIIFDSGTWVYMSPMCILNLHLNFVSYDPLERVDSCYRIDSKGGSQQGEGNPGGMKLMAESFWFYIAKIPVMISVLGSAFLDLSASLTTIAFLSPENHRQHERLQLKSCLLSYLYL